MNAEEQAQLRIAVMLFNGKWVTTHELAQGMEEAMKIIETVGTTEINHKYQQASEWLRKYYPEHQ